MARVLLAMSGGLDSSVSALRLKEAGHDVVGVFMRHGIRAEGTARPGKQGCCSLNDAWDARRVADQLGIPFYVLNFEEPFAKIIDYFVREYDRGATPNPCIRCNQWLKFGRLFETADSLDCSAVATGHYARVEQGHGRFLLCRGRDARKDQSYVLFTLTSRELARTLFPVGDLEKTEVRRLAREAHLSVQDKPESQDICFVPDRDYGRLIRQRTQVEEGEIRTVEGRVVGRHAGHQLYTIGQRKGLGVAFGKPMYVVSIDAATNTVVVGEDDDLKRDSLVACEVTWSAVDPEPGESYEVRVKIRYNHEAAPATVQVLEGKRAQVNFTEPQRAITPGQAAVFYQGSVVLGGGWIQSD